MLVTNNSVFPNPEFVTIVVIVILTSQSIDITLREERRLRVLENVILRRVFGHEGYEWGEENASQ